MTGRPCTDEVRVKVPSFQKVTLFSVILTIHQIRSPFIFDKFEDDFNSCDIKKRNHMLFFDN